MQETDKILKKLSNALHDADLEEYYQENSEYQLPKLYDFFSELKKREENLNQKELELKNKEKNLDDINESLVLKEKTYKGENFAMKQECDWIENEAKRQLCKDFILEIIFSIEKSSLNKEENLIAHTKQISIDSYEKLQNSLQNFEKLANHFKVEAKDFLPPEPDPIKPRFTIKSYSKKK